ncbi:YjcZ family sporulation protein [Halalkalibacter sp. APA_J-10(15)]|nr:YjcZ family sporulation protein [Halalkalibacter sp. APA_J-10(15)]MCK0469855.1 YjcZ family sporulation protein [Halalkalibacter sp. APA_J-10(15)]
MDAPYGAPSYGYDYAAPSYGYAAPAQKSGFVLIVVLFILLIIVGSSFPKC